MYTRLFSVTAKKIVLNLEEMNEEYMCIYVCIIKYILSLNTNKTLKNKSRDFPNDPVIKTLLSIAGSVGSTRCPGAKIPPV